MFFHNWRIKICIYIYRYYCLLINNLKNKSLSLNAMFYSEFHHGDNSSEGVLKKLHYEAMNFSMHFCVFGCSSDVLWNSRGFNSYVSIFVAAIPNCDLLARVSWRTSPWTVLHLGWEHFKFLPYYPMPSMNIVCVRAWMWVVLYGMKKS